MKYSATIDLISEPTAKLKIGQWVKTNKGRGQVVALKAKKVLVSYCGRGDGFIPRVKRMSRAVWYNRELDTVSMVKLAPLSLTIAKLKKRLFGVN